MGLYLVYLINGAITAVAAAAVFAYWVANRKRIAAETIGYDDYIAYKGEQGAKEAGKMRVEGKTYVVRDGDVMLFRFNV